MECFIFCLNLIKNFVFQICTKNVLNFFCQKPD